MENIQPQELSNQELDNVAGGAFSVDAISSDFLKDQQVSATVVGGDGSIATFNAQDTQSLEADVFSIKATGDLPTLPTV
jgi:hypothetical protein